MADDHPTEPCAGDSTTPAEEDARTERRVLTRVLHHHPTRLTMPELAREVCEDPDDFGEGDALARAVRDLTAAGLLRMEGAAVVPTLAAIHSDRLLADE
jgi:hypothetical protein